MSILLIRHGETALNVQRVLQPAATPLSARGLAQAGLLAQRLARDGVAAVVSSDLPRAAQTAKAIAEACAAPLFFDALLQERNFGDLRGRSYDALGYDPLTMPGAPPGGESLAAFHGRVAAAFAAVVAREASVDGHLAVVTHGLVIHALVSRLLQLPDGTRCPPSIANTAVSIVSRTPPHRVELLDCTAHLTPGSSDSAGNLSGG